MKRNIVLLLMFVGLFQFSTNAQDLPQPSPAAKVIQTVGLTEFTVTYSRPGVKGRTIFGDLVPYDKVWRTGANKATSIEFNTDITMEGKSVPAGKYSLFTIPGKDKWEVIINKNTELWGAGDYKQAEDVVRFSVTPEKSNTTESMVFVFDNVIGDDAKLTLAWADVKISMNIKVDSKAAAMNNIENAIKEAEGTFRTYNSSARYYLDNNMDAAQALKWASKSVETSKRFWNVKTLSEAYAANNDYKMAIKTAEESLKLSEEAKYEPYVKMNTENIEKWKKMK